MATPIYTINDAPINTNNTNNVIDINYYKTLYNNIKGKSNSMYVYVLYECTQDLIKDHIKKQFEIVNRSNDSFKRSLLSSRYFGLKSLVESNKDDHVYNCVIFVGTNTTEHPLTNFNKQILKRFDHQRISYSYDDHFDLNFLEDLIFNDDPYHMFRVNSNRIDYIQLTKYKKISIKTKESKSLDIEEFINESLSSTARYVICGVSTKITKNIYDDHRVYAVINKTVKDSEFIDLIDQINQQQILDSLVDDLTMMSDIKTLHRIIFKKDITTCIRNAQLQTLYINIKLVDKILDSMKKANVPITFKMCIIDPSIKSFNDEQEKILDQYAGVVGVTYY